jgi:hypothetical protein
MSKDVDEITLEKNSVKISYTRLGLIVIGSIMIIWSFFKFVYSKSDDIESVNNNLQKHIYQDSTSTIYFMGKTNDGIEDIKKELSKINNKLDRIYEFKKSK